MHAAATYLLPHLPPDMCEPLLAVEALCLQPPVAQHLRHLRVLLPVLAEDQLALVIVVLVLSTSPILATLCARIARIAQESAVRGGHAAEDRRTFPLFCGDRAQIKKAQGDRWGTRTFGMLC